MNEDDTVENASFDGEVNAHFSKISGIKPRSSDMFIFPIEDFISVLSRV